MPRCRQRSAERTRRSTGRPQAPAAHSAARSSSSSRSRSLRVSAAARSNSARASSKRPSFARRSPRTLGKQVIVLERALGGQRVDERETGRRAERHRDRDGAVELDDRRRRQLARARRRARRCAAQSVSPAPCARAWHAAIAACSAYGPACRQARCARSSAARPRRIKQVIPARAVLFEQKDRLAVRPRARACARGLDFHQRDEAVHFGLVRRELGEDAAEAQRVFAELRTHPVVAGGRRIAFVEDEVDDFEHRREPRGELVAARHFERHAARRRAFASRARCAARSSVPATRNARAISSVVRPPSRRSVSATRASVESTGWHAMKTSRSRSSPMSSSIAASNVGDRVFVRRLRSRGRARRACVSASSLRRTRSMRAVLRGLPSATRRDCPGRRTSATARARRRARPARALRRRRRRARCARARR